MQNYSIGLSGLNAAYAALDVIGNNIANAATDGYHRQRVELVTAPPVRSATGMAIGGGVDVAGVTRMINTLLEREILRQTSTHSEISQELSVLSSVEATLGEFAEEGGLNATIDAFFDALRSLAANPLDDVWRLEAISAGEVLASEFRRLGRSLEDVANQIVLEAQHTAGSMNQLIQHVAALNDEILTVEITGEQANNLRDQRDQLIVELAELAQVEIVPRDHGVVDVSIAGLPVVTGVIPLEVSVDLQGDGTLALHVAGSDVPSLSVRGGRLGGLFSLKNELLGDLQADLDSLATGIIGQINQYHVQGVGTEGAFTELAGWLLGSDDLSAARAPITDGTFYIRVTNTSTGVVERHAVDVDVSGATPDTLTSIAAKIDAIVGLNASLATTQLNIVSDPGYTFDFIPAVLPEPTLSNLTAAAPPNVTVSGIYDGAVNDTFTFVVVGSGTVGNGSLRLDVTNLAGDVVGALNVGSGYAAGDVIEMTNGIKITLGGGDLNAMDRFEVDAFASSDTSGFLAAAGMNTFFLGTGASDMAVCQRIMDDPGRVATAIGGGLADNVAALRLSGVRDERVGSLDDLTPHEYYQRMIASLGQDVALKEARKTNIEAMLANLKEQQSDISGVNINDEAAQLLVFEKMFQAVAKYLGSLQTAMTALMDIL